MSTSARGNSDSRLDDDTVSIPEPEQNNSSSTSDSVTSVELRRSMRIMFFADTLSMLFFAAIQGAVFNFYIEDLGLKHRLGWFMGLSSLGGVGALFGSWLQAKTGARWAIHHWGALSSRLLWILIGGMPIFFPQVAGTPLGQAFFIPLSVALFVYFFLGAMAGNAWLSWMSDLLPKNKQGFWWGFRQIGIMGSAALSRVGFGWYLEGHRGWDGYLTIYAFATFIAVINVCLYIFVKHPKVTPTKTSLTEGLKICWGDRVFRRFIAIFLIWTSGNALMGPPIYLYLREKVGMGVTEISLIETLNLLVHTAMGFLWGLFADRHGYRGSMCFCLILQGLGLLLIIPAEPGSSVWVYLAWVVCPIGGAGITILMWPALFSTTETMRENRTTAIAVFTLFISLGNFIAFNLIEPVLYPLGHYLLGPNAINVYLSIIILGIIFRVVSGVLVLRLPAAEHEVPPGIMVRMFTQTNPLRAALHVVRFVTTGRKSGEAGPLSDESHEMEKEAAKALRHAEAYTAAAKRSLHGPNSRKTRNDRKIA